MTAKATLAATAAACLIIGGIGGYSISKLTSPKSGFNRQGGPMASGQKGQAQGGGRVMGEVQSITDGRITLKTQNNNSQIVITSSTTAYQKMATGSAGDVAVGSQVQITGTKNSDGSTTATSVQIVPQGENAPGNPPSGVPGNEAPPADGVQNSNTGTTAK